MTGDTQTLTGTIQPDGTLVLDGRLGLKPGKARVQVSAIPASPEERCARFLRSLAESHARLAAAGHHPPSAADVDAELRTLRDEGEARLEALERIRRGDVPQP